MCPKICRFVQNSNQNPTQNPIQNPIQNLGRTQMLECNAEIYYFLEKLLFWSLDKLIREFKQGLADIQGVYY
jgi:hypothetical protein